MKKVNQRNKNSSTSFIFFDWYWNTNTHSHVHLPQFSNWIIFNLYLWHLHQIQQKLPSFLFASIYVQPISFCLLWSISEINNLSKFFIFFYTKTDDLIRLFIFLFKEVCSLGVKSRFQSICKVHKCILLLFSSLPRPPLSPLSKNKRILAELYQFFINVCLIIRV